MEVTNSTENRTKGHHVLISGPPGHGKSVCAATASEKSPDEFTDEFTAEQGGGLTNLDDVLFLNFDRQATAGFADLGIEVPEIDLSTCSGKEIISSTKEALKVAKARAIEGVTKTVVVDTISSLDAVLVAFWKEATANRWDMYNAILTTHMRFAMALKEIPANVVVICHAKAINEAEDAQGRARQKAAAGPAPASISLDITGQARGYWQRNVPLQLPLICRTRGSRVERHLYPSGVEGFEAKSRFKLADKEPAHLRKLFEKIGKVA